MKESDSPEEALSIEQKSELCQQRIGYRFNDPKLVISALTHASVASSRSDSNERMEFLGDAILGMVVCEQVFRSYPEYLEGDLTKIKSVVVSRRVCAKVSKSLGLEECLIVGRGMLKSGMPRSLLSDVFEAIVAAVFLDAGLEEARKFILRFLDAELRLSAEGHSIGNYKSVLQQLVQGSCKGSPVYRLVGESGPDHSKYFEVAAEITGKRYASAWGRSKKDAEQRAAANALAELRGEEPPFPNSYIQKLMNKAEDHD
jgi:ribonuclease-3